MAAREVNMRDKHCPQEFEIAADKQVTERGQSVGREKSLRVQKIDGFSILDR